MIYDPVKDKFRDECGVFGIYSNDNLDVARLAFYAMYALQHRGEESSGIAVNDSGTILNHKNTGLISEIFNDVILNHLKGQSAIGHVRSSYEGSNTIENAQPMLIKYRSGQLALAHNGSLTNSLELRESLEEKGAMFQTSSDTEIVANLISRYSVFNSSIEDILTKVMKDIKGSYAMTILTPEHLIGLRDPLGIRPLCIGAIGNSYVIASESSGLDAVGASFLRDVKPGEIVIIDKNGLRSVQAVESKESRLCIFEFVYFARPDSYIDGASVHHARVEAGRILAREHPADADLVIGAPDSGINAALGFSRESGIPYGQGLLKNKYVGRTFILPEQAQREIGVRIKFNVLRDEIEGKRIVMVDDSIVRGTTTMRIVQLLKNAGAKEVHMRVSSPPCKFPCYYGIDISSSKQLVASNYSEEEIRKMIGADSIGYLSLEGLLKSPIGSKCGFCTACFNGDYPIDISQSACKNICGNSTKKQEEI
ncbi:MAG TPA: amidophosphoribosyltransferase [Clostridiaceae bacterium]|nr:amidophosphoribosyltransferase [Clostridiaceae bacterium]